MEPEPSNVRPLNACDLDGNGVVDTVDVMLFSFWFGEKEEDVQSEQELEDFSSCDFNSDGQVDEQDLFVILSKWQPAGDKEPALPFEPNVSGATASLGEGNGAGAE